MCVHFLFLAIATISSGGCCDALAGEGDAGRDLRAKLTGAMLASDMAAFKAANPGAVFEDVVRWLSPRDWLLGDGAGRLSKRMSVQVPPGRSPTARTAVCHQINKGSDRTEMSFEPMAEQLASFAPALDFRNADLARPASGRAACGARCGTLPRRWRRPSRSR